MTEQEQSPKDEKADPHQAFLEFCKQKAQEPESEGKAPKAPPCPHCGGRGYVRIERDGFPCTVACRCRKKHRIQAALDKANIPPKFRDYTLDAKPSDGRRPFKPWGGPTSDKVALQSQKLAWEHAVRIRDAYIAKFLKHEDVQDPYGLMLYGDSGRGKTHLVCSLLTDLVYAGLKDVRFIEYNELFKQVRFSFRSQDITYQSVFDSLTKPRVLVIDDFGTDVGGDLMWVLDNISYIINERYNRNLPTISTSNYWVSLEDENNGTAEPANPYESRSHEMTSKEREHRRSLEYAAARDKMEQRVTYRLRSRIREMCLEVKIEGYDYRRRISRNRQILLERESKK